MAWKSNSQALLTRHFRDLILLFIICVCVLRSVCVCVCVLHSVCVCYALFLCVVCVFALHAPSPCVEAHKNSSLPLSPTPSLLVYFTLPPFLRSSFLFFSISYLSVSLHLNDAHDNEYRLCVLHEITINVTFISGVSSTVCL